MSLIQINLEIKEIGRQIALLEFDEEGNAKDRELADKLFAREDELYGMLGVKNPNVTIL